MPTSQQVFGSWLRTEIALLRQHGFTGNEQNYHRRIGPNWAAINFQRGSYSTSDELTFTVNLGTASAVVMSAAREDPVRDAIRRRHADAVGHDRPLLGYLLRELEAIHAVVNA